MDIIIIVIIRWQQGFMGIIQSYCWLSIVLKRFTRLLGYCIRCGCGGACVPYAYLCACMVIIL